jgi:hypothetical protein
LQFISWLNKNKKRTDLEMVMELNHPILLLLALSTERAIERLASVVAADDLVHSYHESIDTGSDRRLLYKGVDFSVRVVAGQGDIGSFKHIFCNSDLNKTLSAVAIGLDGNVSGGERIAPVASCLLEFGAYLAGHMAAHAVAWAPASIVSDIGYFSTAVTDYVGGGVFPSLSVVDFVFSDDSRCLETQGLSWFSGQELELHGEGLTQAEIMRRAVRIVHDIATNGPVETAQTIPDLDPQHLLSLNPDADRSLVIGTIQSNLDVVHV